MMNKILSVMEEAVTQAGLKIIKAAPTEGVAEKEGRANFVTAADLASEKVIVDIIRANFPDHDILSEETASDIQDPRTVDHLWVIDPIDGTGNFRYGRGYSAISVGYVERGQIKAGAVYDPFRQQLFSAELGKGATLNKKPIKPGSLGNLAKATVGTDNSSYPEGTKHNLELLLKLKPAPWCLIRGSAVLAICDVAAGRLDLYFHTFLKPWDNAAAFLIAQEVGARVCGLDGDSINFMSQNAVVGNPDLVKQFVKQLASELQ